MGPGGCLLKQMAFSGVKGGPVSFWGFVKRCHGKGYSLEEGRPRLICLEPLSGILSALGISCMKALLSGFCFLCSSVDTSPHLES